MSLSSRVADPHEAHNSAAFSCCNQKQEGRNA